MPDFEDVKRDWDKPICPSCLSQNFVDSDSAKDLAADDWDLAELFVCDERVVWRCECGYEAPAGLPSIRQMLRCFIAGQPFLADDVNLPGLVAVVAAGPKEKP